MTEQRLAGEPTLSVIIPAFNEAERLPTSLARLRTYLDERFERSEVIVVDDGSSDGTSEVVAAWSRRWPSVRLVRGPHRGKGAAVREGVLAARGAYVAFADADFSMPPEEFDRFRQDTAEAADMVIGSREAPGARRIDEPVYRHIMGRAFNTLVRILLFPGIQDTQCGFKWMRRDIAVDLCHYQTIEGWAFDVELLYIARLHGYHVREVPITWYYMPGTRIHPVRDTITMARDVLMIRFNGVRGCYDKTTAACAKSLPSR